MIGAALAYKLHDTAHLEKRARDRGFTIEQITPAINEPASILKTPPRKGNHGGFIWLFFRAFESRILVVVAEVKANECWIITGSWEERH
jgi:hypothetical protein